MQLIMIKGSFCVSPQKRIYHSQNHISMQEKHLPLAQQMLIDITFMYSDLAYKHAERIHHSQTVWLKFGIVGVFFLFFFLARFFRHA